MTPPAVTPPAVTPPAVTPPAATVPPSAALVPSSLVPAAATPAAKDLIQQAAARLSAASTNPLAATPAAAQGALDKLAQASSTAIQLGTNVIALIDQAKKLLGDNKVTEALAVINSLASQKLSADQQKTLADLKAQATQAVTSKATEQATKVLGGLLNKTN